MLVVRVIIRVESQRHVGCKEFIPPPSVQNHWFEKNKRYKYLNIF